MTDLIFVAVVVAFFAIAGAYVKGCARIVGDDDVVRADTEPATGSDAGTDTGTEPVGATDASDAVTAR